MFHHCKEHCQVPCRTAQQSKNPWLLGEPLQGGPGSKVQLPVKGALLRQHKNSGKRIVRAWKGQMIPSVIDPYRSRLCSANVKWTLSPARTQCWSVALHLENYVRQKLAKQNNTSNRFQHLPTAIWTRHVCKAKCLYNQLKAGNVFLGILQRPIPSLHIATETDPPMVRKTWWSTCQHVPTCAQVVCGGPTGLPSSLRPQKHTHLAVALQTAGRMSSYPQVAIVLFASAGSAERPTSNSAARSFELWWSCPSLIPHQVSKQRRDFAEWATASKRMKFTWNSYFVGPLQQNHHLSLFPSQWKDSARLRNCRNQSQ